MAASTSSNPATRMGGLALLVGVVLLFVASFLLPGGVLNPVDQTDFPLALETMAANASAAHLASMLSIGGMFLYMYAASTWLRLPGTTGFGGTCLRLGAFASMFGWSLYLVAMGMRQFSVHLMQRGMQPGADQAMLESFALSAYAAMAGIVVALVSVYPLASILVGIGFASRFDSMGLFKVASCGFVVLGVVASINHMVLQHVPTIDPRVLLVNDNGMQALGSLCFVIIGIGMYRGRSELTSDD